jgi:hypothetical protein
VNFVFEPNDDGVSHPSSAGALGVRGDIRLAGVNIDGAGNVLAFTYLPPSGSDMVLDTTDILFYSDNSQNLNFINFRDTLMHEIGHAFGMQHVSTTSALLMEPTIDTSFDGPQLDEVRGVQFFFGDANEESNGGLGNDSAPMATSLGLLPASGAKTIGAAADVANQAISPTATDFVSISNVDDDDYYSFVVPGPSELAVTLTPRGGVFSQAAQFTTPTSFDANARNNLGLTIFAPDGFTSLAIADTNPAGSVESVANLVLPAAGTYFARATGRNDTIQLYELSLTATPILVGDYNKNGVVDGADYVVWRRTQGQPVTLGTGADGNFDGQITATDYNVWRSNFGQTAGSGTGSVSDTTGAASVPEPTTSLLLAALGWNAATVALLRRRTARSNNLICATVSRLCNLAGSN